MNDTSISKTESVAPDTLRDTDIHYINLSREDHKLISADPAFSVLIGEDIYSSFENHVAPEDRAFFLRQMANFSANWIPLRLKLKGETDLFYLRQEGTPHPDYLRLAVVRISDLLKNHRRRMSIIWSLESILDLYDDVSFVYRPAEDQVELFHSDHTIFSESRYSFSAFSQILLYVAQGESQVNAVFSFLNHMKEKHAFFSAQLSGNLIGSDDTIHSTLLVGRTNLRSDNEVEVVGIIHPDRMGRNNLSSLKRDYLTGAVLKEDITQLGSRRIDEEHLDGTAIAIIDVDYFKLVNDLYGHSKGDLVLQQVAQIISHEVGNDGILGRIGGDEFMVVFFHLLDEQRVRAHLHNIKDLVQAAFPGLGPDEVTPLSVSIGCAVYPTDAQSYNDLFMTADYCLYLAKNKGRNRYVFYVKDKHPSLDFIRSSRMNTGNPLLPRGNESPADAIISMLYDLEHGRKKPSLEKLLTDFAFAFRPSNLLLFVGASFDLLYESGPERFTDASVSATISRFLRQGYGADLMQDFFVVNRVENLPDSLTELKSFYLSKQIYSFLSFRFQDQTGTPGVLLLLSIGSHVQWNQQNFRYYHVFIDILKRYGLRES